MRKYLTREEEKEKRLNQRINIGIFLLTVISASVGFTLRGTIEEKYFRQQEPQKHHIIEPQPETQPFQRNYTPKTHYLVS